VLEDFSGVIEEVAKPAKTLEPHEKFFHELSGSEE
jgi:hypothetical protein